MGVKYKVDNSFFEVWSKPMAYVLGYICADGSLEDSPYIRGKYLRVSSIDRASIENIKKALASEHTIVESKPDDPKRQIQYMLRIGDKKIYNDLMKRGVYPRKSLTLAFPNIPKNFLADFVRGYFDGDGCVTIERGIGTHGQVILKRLATIFTCGCRKFLVDLENKLEKSANMSTMKIYPNQRAFQLRFSTLDSYKLFKFMYEDAEGLFLQRKYDIFREYLSIPGRSTQKRAAEILGNKAWWRSG